MRGRRATYFDITGIFAWYFPSTTLQIAFFSPEPRVGSLALLAECSFFSTISEKWRVSRPLQHALRIVIQCTFVEQEH